MGSIRTQFKWDRPAPPQIYILSTPPCLRAENLENWGYTPNSQPLTAVLTGALPSVSTPHRGRGSACSSATL